MLIVSKGMVILVGEPGYPVAKHAQFFYLVQHLAEEFNKAGRPLSGSER